MTWPNDLFAVIRRRVRRAGWLRRGWLLIGGLGAGAMVAGACESRTLWIGEVQQQGAGGCASLGASCQADSGCCSAYCESGMCSEPTTQCRALGDSCGAPRDCCSNSCLESRCAGSCVSDSDSCSLNEECCSGLCSGGACSPLTIECLTSGNACAANTECCSGLCRSGRCDAQSSYCSQFNDVCSNDQECCSGSCVFASEGVYGTCADAPPGPSNCSKGIAGSVCDGCNDCCSRVCVPYGSTGVSICQEALGCRQTGELCANDAECCGGDVDAALPGAGNVGCWIEDGASYGICRNAQSCSPQGNSCHFQNYVCGVSSSSNKCCAADGAEGLCELDFLGVPRCNGLGDVCLNDGERCAIAEDCCQGACLPDDSGFLVCSAFDACTDEGNACTSAAECCPGLNCSREIGSSFGSCETSGAVSCSLSGQLCDGDYPTCCGGLPCVDGRCRGTGAP